MKILNNNMYLLLIDEDAEIKEGNYVYSVLYGIGQIIRDIGGESTKNYRPLVAKFQESEVHQEYGRDGIWQMDVVGEKVAKNNCEKVVAYYPLKKEAKELDLPVLPSFEEIDVEELAEQHLQKWRGLNNVHLSNRIHAARCKNDFIAGYEAAQQSNKQFTLDEMKKAFIDGLEFIAVDPNRYEEDADNYIQSLSTQQTYSKEFIPDTEIVYASKGLADKGFIYEEVFKTITNSEGKEELVGVWLDF